MKIIITLISLIFSLNSFASQVPTEAEMLLPIIVKDVVVRGNLMPIVQPKAILTTVILEVSFCRNVSADEFALEIQQTNMRAYKLAVVAESGFVDCFGPTHRQTITLTTNELPAYVNISFKNPVLVTNQIVH